MALVPTDMASEKTSRPAPVSLRFSAEELERIDRHVAHLGISRHAYLKRAALKRLHRIDPSVFALALARLAKIKDAHASAAPEEAEALSEDYAVLREIFTQALGKK